MGRMKQFFQNLAGRGEFLIPLSFLIVSAYLFYLAFEFRGAFVMIRQGVGPDFFPKVFTALMMFLGLWLIYNAVKRGGVSEFEKVANPRNLWITFAFMIAYAFLLEIVGFVVLTPTWIAAYMFALSLIHISEPTRPY